MPASPTAPTALRARPASMPCGASTMSIFFGPLAVTQAMLPLLCKSPSGRIVNVSSGLGSLAYNGDPSWEFAHAKFLGYNSSKGGLEHADRATRRRVAEHRHQGQFGRSR